LFWRRGKKGGKDKAISPSITIDPTIIGSTVSTVAIPPSKQPVKGLNEPVKGLKELVKGLNELVKGSELAPVPAEPSRLLPIGPLQLTKPGVRDISTYTNISEISIKSQKTDLITPTIIIPAREENLITLMQTDNILDKIETDEYTSQPLSIRDSGIGYPDKLSDSMMRYTYMYILTCIYLYVDIYMYMPV
jgi:hypothetical protein